MPWSLYSLLCHNMPCRTMPCHGLFTPSWLFSLKRSTYMFVCLLKTNFLVLVYYLRILIQTWPLCRSFDKIRYISNVFKVNPEQGVLLRADPYVRGNMSSDQEPRHRMNGTIHKNDDFLLHRDSVVIISTYFLSMWK
jgi:hypothetical protein